MVWSRKVVSWSGWGRLSWCQLIKLKEKLLSPSFIFFILLSRFPSLSLHGSHLSNKISRLKSSFPQMLSMQGLSIWGSLLSSWSVCGLAKRDWRVGPLASSRSCSDSLPSTFKSSSESVSELSWKLNLWMFFAEWRFSPSVLSAHWLQKLLHRCLFWRRFRWLSWNL